MGSERGSAQLLKSEGTQFLVHVCTDFGDGDFSDFLNVLKKEKKTTHKNKPDPTKVSVMISLGTKISRRRFEKTAYNICALQRVLLTPRSRRKMTKFDHSPAAVASALPRCFPILCT